MNIQHYKLNLDLLKKTAPQILHSYQFDNKSRYVDITLTANDAEFTLDSTMTAVFNAVTNNVIVAESESCTILNNIITIELTDKVLSLSGITKCEVVLSDSNGAIITAQHFFIKVSEKAINNKSKYEPIGGTLATKTDIDKAVATAKTEAVQQADALLDEYDEAVVAKLNLKADKQNVYTKQEIDALLADIDTSQVLFANSIEECTDTKRLYVLPDGYIYAYTESTVEKEVTKTIDGELDNTRVSNDSTANANGYVTTALIDLKAYPTQFVLHLDGVAYIPETVENYTRYAYFDENQAFVASSKTSASLMKSVLGATEANSYTDGKSSITFDNIKQGLRYVRFSGAGTSESSNVYITYQQIVTESLWTNTGVKFGNSAELDEKIATLNNEGSDPETVTLLPAPVLEFYNTSDYTNDDYTVSYLKKITYPCRADIPVPFTVKWKHDENAMRTTVAIDTKMISSNNAYSLRLYDVTGIDNYPIYNLLPNTIYYYQITHIFSDGSLVVAKKGSFKTSSESIRLLNIDGTQNVRDLGGWIGLNNKKIKYGKIIRGASFSDSSYPNLMLTGKGKLALGNLKVQAELNLGAVDTETSIAQNCVYKKIGYSNYALAITDQIAKSNFKLVLEWIVDCLENSKNIYMHCQGGCDRTGTLSFLLLGLLGVSESDLAKEYELSSFSSVGYGRLRTTTKAIDTYDYVGMVEALKTYNGDTITDKFYDFATNDCEISADTIETFRTLMLE